MHEEIADTLMRLARPKDAAAEYALVIKSHPGRARALLGAARAAARTGAKDDARAAYRQLLDLWSGADEGTDGLAEARKAVAAPAAPAAR
jgi:TolA-binding protein